MSDRFTTFKRPGWTCVSEKPTLPEDDTILAAKHLQVEIKEAIDNSPTARRTAERCMEGTEGVDFSTTSENIRLRRSYHGGVNIQSSRTVRTGRIIETVQIDPGPREEVVYNVHWQESHFPNTGAQRVTVTSADTPRAITNARKMFRRIQSG